MHLSVCFHPGFAYDNNCDVTVSHVSEGHAEQPHGHKTPTSSQSHGEKKHEQGHEDIKGIVLCLDFVLL